MSVVIKGCACFMGVTIFMRLLLFLCACYYFCVPPNKIPPAREGCTKWGCGFLNLKTFGFKNYKKRSQSISFSLFCKPLSI